MVYKNLIDKNKLNSMYSFEDFEKVMLKNQEEKMLFLKKFLKDVSIENENFLIDHVLDHTTNLMDSKEFDQKRSIDKILDDKEDVLLSVFNRQHLRQKLLNELCHSYFYKRGEKFRYYAKEFDSLPYEKKLAFEYFEDAGFIKIDLRGNVYSIKPTQKAIDDYENYISSVKVIRKQVEIK